MFFIYMLFVVKKKKEKEKKRKKRETIQFWRNAHQYIYIYIEKKRGEESHRGEFISKTRLIHANKSARN